MTLAERLAEGRFVVTAELNPPAEPDAGRVRDAAAALAGVVHAANVTDNAAATARMSPLVCAALMLDAGLEPILQLTARDRNLLALQSELIGAWAVGVRTVLALSGDPLGVGRYHEFASEVRDLDSIGLAKLIAALNEGRMAAGEPLAMRTGFLIAGAVLPLVDSVERIESKLAAGCRLLQTNIVYEPDRFAAWFAPVVDAGVAARAPVLVGVAPPRSEAMLRHLHDNIPGVEVDDATFARMSGLRGEAAKEEGIRIAAEVVARLRDVAGVAGVHIMAPGWEGEAVPRVVEAASLAMR